MKFKNIFCIIFLVFGYPQNIKGSIFLGKREVDLEIYSDREEVIETEQENDGIVDVCGGLGNGKVECYCDIEEKRIQCVSGLQHASLRPIVDNFVLEKVHLMQSSNLNLQKGKIFPENRDTIELLEFKYIEFYQIDDGIFDDLPSLKTLIIDSSGFPRFLKLQESILTAKMGKSLLKLQMTYSRLYSLDPSIFTNLISLEKLVLNGNKQENEKIDGRFPVALSNLKTLELAHCNLIVLDENLFKNLKNLVALCLSRNRFTSIPKSINALSNLEKFYFTDNYNLVSIDDCAFCGNFNLKVIVLWDCFKLKFFHENAFGTISKNNVPSIEDFSIESCNISVLPERLLDWKNVKYLELNRNPFACNCSMAWLFKDLLSENSIYKSKINSSSYYDSHFHHKFRLGCLGEPQFTENHTFPKSIHDVFDSCEISASFSPIFWLFVGFLILACILFFVGFYFNRIQFERCFFNC